MIAFHATRLAPSPTGALHLGHARTFLLTWWMARQAGAKIYMRMEDLDAGRAKPEAVQQAYDDLRWLGMDWDAYEETPNAKHKTQNEIVQSERLALYAGAIDMLRQKKAIYPCVCSRAEIAAQVAGAASAPHEGDANPRYPGTCRGRFAGRTLAEGLEQARRETGKEACLRLLVREGVIRFEDAIAGAQAVDVAQDAGDFPITRFAVRHGGEHRQDADATRSGATLPPAYQLACVVDDHAMEIDMVIRGDDLLASTPRQLLLYEALGYTPPRFAHVPLVIGTDGKRLAKRHGESRIAQFRAAGISPERVVGWVAWRSGQIDRPREISARYFVSRFDLGRLPRERITLTAEDLAFLR